MENRLTEAANSLSKPARISYWVLLLTFVFVGWLHLATPLLAVLFSYFVLDKLQFGTRRWLAVFLFLAVLFGIAYALAHLINQAVVALPKIADTAIPSIIAWAEA